VLLSHSLVHELVREILNDVQLPKKPLDAYEFDKTIHLVDIPLYRTVIGHINGRRNVLTFNFWALMFGILGDFNAGGAVNTGGASYTLRTSGRVDYGAASLVYGSDSTPEAQNQYKLGSYVGSISTSISLGALSDRNRITLSGVVPGNAYELGIYQQFYEYSGSYAYTTMLARKAMFVPANSSVNWYIDFLYPWIQNMAVLMYGLLRYADVSGAVDDAGNSYVVRTSGDVNAGAVRLRLSSSQYSWSPTLTRIRSDLEATLYLTYANYQSVVHLFMTGIVIPSSDLTVNTIALVQPLYDSSGSTRYTYLAVIPLSSPITFYGGRANTVVIRLMAM